MTLPIVDLHCDLLDYLTADVSPDINNREDIGCALPCLAEGNVKLQVMALYAADGLRSVIAGALQTEQYRRLPDDYPDAFAPVDTSQPLSALLQSGKTHILASIENASNICTADDPLDLAFARLDQMIAAMGRILYISFTHHTGNRFGGGNRTTDGITDDGRALLDYISGRGIAYDLSHNSDALAHDALNHIDKHNLDIPVMASHSNYRPVCEQPRNLPDELAREIIARDGVIGLNFIRAFVDPDDPSALLRHLEHGLSLGGERAIAIGADFCCMKNYADASRMPYYHPEHAHAGLFPELFEQFASVLDEAQLTALAHGNALRFIGRVLPN